jgi:hypothetical protein
MALAMIISADPTEDIYYKDLDGLDEYQFVVGGSIETIPYRDNVTPYFNEEGKIFGLPENVRATALLRNFLMAGDYIAGNCILVGFDPETGEDIDLPEGTLTSDPA